MSVTTSAISGMQAAVTRLNASASNVANMETRGAIPPAAADAPAVYRPVQAVQSFAGRGGGVITVLVQATPGWSEGYDPSAPFADARGMVAVPEIALPDELVEQLEARTQFIANLRVLQSDDRMQRALLDLKT